MTSLARALRRRSLSPVDLVSAYLARIERADGMHAFITVTGELARRQAVAAERALRHGDPGELLGVPLAIKDLFATAGLRTTAGSRILRGWVPREDGTAVARLKAAGAVVLGKLNLHEFAYGVTNANPHWGVARNPRDLARIPGGSSGGSAIAVVMGLCAGSLGSDTGGSIRIPAALCGCVGLKPTYGAVPTDGVVPLAWSLDHAGPVTRSVDDARLLFDVIADRPPTGHRPIRGLTLGVVRGAPLNPVQPGVLRVVGETLRSLRGAGIRLRTVSPLHIELGVAAQLVTLRAEAATFHARWLRRRAADYGADVRTRLYLGTLVSAAEYVVAQRARERMREGLKEVFRRVDLLALPTVPVVAPAIGQRLLSWRTGAEPVDAALVRLTSPFNLTGVPALSVPCGLSRGLPVGLQLVAPWREEARLFDVGRAVESLSR